MESHVDLYDDMFVYLFVHLVVCLPFLSRSLFLFLLVSFFFVDSVHLFLLLTSPPTRLATSDPPLPAGPAPLRGGGESSGRPNRSARSSGVPL